MGFDDVTKEMYLTGFFPGITPRQILDNMVLTWMCCGRGKWRRQPISS